MVVKGVFEIRLSAKEVFKSGCPLSDELLSAV